jgi:hypothetical protein
MFLRHKVRRKDGKEHRYWSIVENRRVSGGRTVQRHLLYLGEAGGRCASADDRRPHYHPVTLYRTRSGSDHPAATVEDEPAQSAAAQGHRRRRSATAMATQAVVPTLPASTAENQQLGQFLSVSSESRVSPVIASCHRPAPLALDQTSLPCHCEAAWPKQSRSCRAAGISYDGDCVGQATSQ